MGGCLEERLGDRVKVTSGGTVRKHTVCNTVCSKTFDRQCKLNNYALIQNQNIKSLSTW